MSANIPLSGFASQVCTAIAMVAAREVHRAHGDFDAVFRTDTQVMEILSEGVVWHSRWLALDTNGTRTAFEVLRITFCCFCISYSDHWLSPTRKVVDCTSEFACAVQPRVDRLHSLDTA